MKPAKKLKAGLVALALQLGILAGGYAGGPAILQLPIEGVTAKNADQCAKLFEKKFAPVLALWNNGDVKMIKDGSTNLVQLRPERGHISLSDVEKALVGSPFTIKREQLMYVSVVQLRIGQIENHEKLVSALATLDGKKLDSYAEEDKDGSLLITLHSPQLNRVQRDRGKVHPLFTHQRLTSYLTKNNVSLIAISWGNNHHRGAPFGARSAPNRATAKPACESNNTDTGDEEAAAVAALQKLGGEVSSTKVVFSNNKTVTDAGLVHLRGLKRLTTLYLPNTSVGDAGLEHLKGLAKLTNLYLPGTKVSDAGLKHLEGLARLSVLYLDRNPVTDTGVENLKGLTQLVTLSLNGTKVTDAGLKHLNGFNNLYHLHLKDTGISDAGLGHLSGLTKLARLDLTNTKVTDAGVKKLQQALPKCRIERGKAVGRPTFKWHSDRNITIREVLSVEVETDTITILAKAHEPKAPALRYLGKQIYLVIKRPPLDYNDEYLQKLLASPRRGPAAKELDLEQFKRHRAQLWQSSVAAAQALKKGGEIELIAFSKPDSKKTGDYITSMEGYGFLFPKIK